MTEQSVMDVFRDVLERFEDNDVPYMIVGSIGSILFGEPRMTKDMDLVVHLRPEDSSLLGQLFPLEAFYCPPPEVLRDEIIQRGQFNLIHHDSGLKVDIMVRKNAPHAVEEFRRRTRVPFLRGFDAYVASPEDIVIKKLDYYREGRSQKHLNDIRGIQANTELDQAYLKHWLDELGLHSFWAEVEGTNCE